MAGPARGWVLPILVAAAIAIAVQLFTQWALEMPVRFIRWDGAHYLYLAQHGYPAHFDFREAFLPGYPLLIRLAMFAIPSPVGAALAVSLAASLAASLAMVKLARQELGNQAGEGGPAFAAWLLALWPGSFFLFTAYSEAPFIAAAAASLHLARRKRFGWAALAGAAACAVRPVGVALAVALVVEMVRRRAFGRLPLAVLVPLPILAYFAYLGWHTGDFWAYLHAEASPDFGIHLAWPWRGAMASWNGSAGSSYLGSIFRTAVIAGVAGAAATVAVLATRRLPLSLGLYCLVSLTLALAEPNWRSVVRYELALFPLAIPLVRWTARRPDLRAALVAAGAAVLTFTAQVFATGHWAG